MDHSIPTVQNVPHQRISTRKAHANLVKKVVKNVFLQFSAQSAQKTCSCTLTNASRAALLNTRLTTNLESVKCVTKVVQYAQPMNVNFVKKDIL